jgi:hypothetical protein
MKPASDTIKIGAPLMIPVRFTMTNLWVGISSLSAPGAISDPLESRRFMPIHGTLAIPSVQQH